MNLPSVKTLSQITDTPEDAKILRSVLECRTREEVCSLSRKADDYVRSCYNPPPLYLVKLYAADEILRTYGVEGMLRGQDGSKITMDYCNTGDSYASTLVYFRGRYRVTSWGDIAERYDR